MDTPVLADQQELIFICKLHNNIVFNYSTFCKVLIQLWVVFAKGPRDLGSILGRVIPKTLKYGTDTSLLNTQQYKVRIKGKVE